MRENLLIVDNFEPEAVLTSGDVAHIRDKAGSMAAKVIAFDSITERKQMEETLRENEQRTRLKPDSILSPEGNTGNLELADIIDTPGLQALMDDFYKLAHIPMSIIDLKGRMLVGVGWQNICMKFHRAHPDACRHCIESDTQLSRGVPPGDLRLYKCKNNMWDIATPIMVGGQHVGNVFSGQFFFEGEPLDYELFRSQARRYGFDEEEYIAGLEAVPRLSREAVDTGMAFCVQFADMLSKLGYSNIKLAQSLAERDRLLYELDALSQVTDVAIGTLELNELLDSLLKRLVTVTRADIAVVLLREGSRLAVQKAIGIEGEEEPGYSLEIGLGFAGTIAQTKEPLYIEDAQTDPRVINPFIKKRGIHSMLGVPVITKGEVIGVLHIDWLDMHLYDERELRLLELVAERAAFAISNARLYEAEVAAQEKARSELEVSNLLLKAADALTVSIDLDEVLSRLAEITLEATGLTRIFINLIYMNRRELIPKVATGGLKAPSGAVISFDQLSITAVKAITAKKTTVSDYELPETPEYDRKIAQANNSRLVLFVPLLQSGEIIGHIALDEPGERYQFSEREIKLVEGIANQAAVAVVNAHLYQAQQNAAETLEAVIENTNTLIAYLDPDMNFLMANDAYVAGSGYTREELIGRYHFDLFPNEENEAIFKRVRDTGQPLEFKAKPFEYTEQPWRGVTYWDWKLAPVKDAACRVIGLVLSLVEVTETIRSERLSGTLNSLNTIINSTHDFDEIMQKVAVDAAKAIGCNKSSIEMRQQGYWEVRYIYGLPQEVLGKRFNFQETVGLEIMVKTKQPFAINGNDVNKVLVPRIIDTFGVGSMMLMPVRVKDNVVAAMRFVYEDARVTFAENQVDFAIKLAAALSLALENARLFEEERKAAQKLAENQNNLEILIKQRTKELEKVNSMLIDEIDMRKKTEEALRLSETQHRQLIEVSPDAYFVFAQNKVLYTNPAALQLFNYKNTEEMDITTLKNLIIPEKFKEIENLRGSQEPVHLGEIIIGKEAFLPKTVEVSVIPVVFEGEKANQYIIRDITQRKEMEKEIARLDRLNLIGEMAAGIGHEVRNPMTSVRGFLQLLENQELDPKKLEYYDIMIDELDRANSIITEFLSLAKDRAVKLKPTSLNSIINSLYPLLSTDAMKQDKRIMLIKGDIPNILLNEKEIRQLIINLVRNGLEAMPSGGGLTIGTYEDSHEVVLFVEDEGTGIKPEIYEKLGTPFVTTKDKGTGLGLSVCYSIANKHDAKIDVKTGSAGTTFYVRFKMQKRLEMENVG